MPVVWSSERYQKLLLALLAAHPDFKPNYKEIAAHFGEGISGEGVRSAFRTMNKKAAALFNSGSAPSNDAPATPKKPKTAKTATPNSKRKRGAVGEKTEEETPRKKAARGKGKGKKEEEEEKEFQGKDGPETPSEHWSVVDDASDDQGDGEGEEEGEVGEAGGDRGE